MNFAKKTYVSLKNKFGKEPDFSKWLATEGIEYLKESLGVELISEGTEVKPNDAFSTDIVLKVDPQYAEGEPPKIVVENQYGRTDHQHFSKLITYAVTNEAKYAVWIAEEIHPEHEISINWLNENTNDNINFYLFKAVIEKIGNSEECFSLIPICEPNSEKKIKMSAKKEMSDLNCIQLKFWQTFYNFIIDNGIGFKTSKPRPQHWYNIYLGTSKANISVCALSLEKKIRFDLWISDDKNLFDKLYLKKNEIEQVVGRSLIWDRKEGSKASSVSYEMDGIFDISICNKYDEYCNLIVPELKEHFYKISKFIN